MLHEIQSVCKCSSELWSHSYSRMANREQENGGTHKKKSVYFFPDTYRKTNMREVKLIVQWEVNGKLTGKQMC